MMQNYYLSSSVFKESGICLQVLLELASFVSFVFQIQIHHLDFFASLEMFSPTPACRKSIQTLFAFLGNSLEKKKFTQLREMSIHIAKEL